MAPYGPLDELLFSHENGYLDAFMLTARPEEFEERRDTWLQENPGREEEYRPLVRRDLREGAAGPQGARGELSRTCGTRASCRWGEAGR